MKSLRLRLYCRFNRRIKYIDFTLEHINRYLNSNEYILEPSEEFQPKIKGNFLKGTITYTPEFSAYVEEINKFERKNWNKIWDTIKKQGEGWWT